MCLHSSSAADMIFLKPAVSRRGDKRYLSGKEDWKTPNQVLSQFSVSSDADAELKTFCS